MDNEELDRLFPLGDGTAQREAVADCPYCGEANVIVLDPGGGARQEYIEDCQVCCQPWTVRVRYHPEGLATVSLERAD